MVQPINVPGQGIINFPDGMSDADIAAAIQKNIPSPQITAPAPNPSYAQVLGNGIVKGATGLADTVVDGFTNAPRDIAQDVETGAATFTNPAQNLPVSLTDPYHPFRTLAQKVGLYSPDKEPQDSIGKAVDFTGQIMGGGGINPASILRSGAEEGTVAAAQNLAAQLAKNTVSGVAGSAAGQVTAALAPNSPIAQTAAQTAGAMLGHGITNLRSTAGDIARSGLSNATPQQIADAQSLMDHAQSIGSSITSAEALAKVQGSNPLQAVQRVVEQSPAGQQTLGPMMTARPANNAAAFQGVADQIGPKPADPYQTPYNLGNAANSAIQDVRQQRSAAASPYYQAAAGEKVDPVGFSDLRGKIAAALDPSKGGVSPETNLGARLGKYLSDLNSSGGYANALDKVYADTRDNINKPDITPNAMNATEKGILRPLNDQLQTLTNGNANIAAGRNIYADHSANVVNPMTQSPVGTLAETLKQNGEPLSADNVMAAQMNTLMPKKPLALDPNTLKYTVNTIGADNVQPWLRQALEGQFGDSNKDLQSGPNSFGGAKYAAALRSNPSQAANLDALVSSASGPTAAQSLGKYLDVMNAQGMRQPAGSLTAYNEKLINQLGNPNSAALDLAPAALSAMKDGNLTAPALEMTDYLRGKYQAFKYGQNTKQLAAVLSDPNGIAKLQALAKTGAANPTARMLAASLLAATNGSATNQARGSSQ